MVTLAAVELWYVLGPVLGQRFTFLLAFPAAMIAAW